MRRISSGRLERFYQQFNGNDNVLILINADPDAIASAMAVKRLLWRKVAAVSIASINVVKRPDNLAMIRLLKVELRHLADVETEHFTRFVIVDSQPDHNPLFAPYDYCAVIDHHPDSGFEAPFRDIRPQYGATATILTQYLRAAKIKPSVKLATGLFHAIQTDTDNFKRQALLEDIQAFQFLFRHANMYLANKINQSELRADFLRYFRIALENRRLYKGRMLVHLGPVPSPDVCVLVADFFMRVNSVKWSIVSGLYDRRLIIIFRNDGIGKNAGKVASQSFGHIGSAGGHKSMARAEIPLSALKAQDIDTQDMRQVAKWIRGQLRHRVVKKK